MFTGIVTSLGSIVELTTTRVVVDAPEIDEALGASVAVDGCCLTVAASADGRIGFDLLPETLERTRIGSLAPGARVNLEPALRAGDPLGGHLVQGHVDAVGTVRSVRGGEDAAWTDVELEVPDDVLRLCVERGSICVNGVSLTIMELLRGGLRLQLIPETARRTNLGAVAPGDPVNLEADVIARYVDRLLPRTR